MKKVIRKLLAITTILMLMVSFLLPASAASGNGYVSDTITLNGVNYPCTVSTAYSSSNGARTLCATSATCTRVHMDVILTYFTENDGLITIQDGYRRHANVSGASYSYYTGFSDKFSSPTNYYEIYSSVVVTCIDQNGTSRQYTFSPYATR